MSVSDVAKELGARWKSAPVELKSKYEQAASENKHAYQNEMANYKHQTSTNSSPPPTPQTPITPHDFQTTFSTTSIQQHPQLEQILLQQQNFKPFDHVDMSEVTSEFDIMGTENPIDGTDA